MPSTLLTAASDICVIAVVATVATNALRYRAAPFKTSLGAEFDDDSLNAAEINDAVGTPGQHPSHLQEHAGDDKKTFTVNVNEVAVTPDSVEVQGEDYFASAKAA